MFSILFLLLLFASCTKRVECDDAQVCVVNTGTDTIHYCWNCNSFTNILLPGESTCKNVGEIKITSNTEITVSTYFESDHGSYIIDVEDCYVEMEID